ncbi:MAG: hypothetical protein P3B98_02855 [Gemmatimonadota bacterium]|nr:hypothetical protein [Gemmatimonadota bacterium]
MFAVITSLRRTVLALAVCGSAAAGQRTVTPRILPTRVAGELAAGAVAFTLGAEGGLVAAAGVAYLIRGHGGEVDDPQLVRALTPLLWAGGGLGAGTGAWLVSRTNGQASDWGANVAVSTVVSAVAFRYAGWPMTPATKERQRHYSAWRRAAPVWLTALAAAAVATGTREKRVTLVIYPKCCAP